MGVETLDILSAPRLLVCGWKTSSARLGVSRAAGVERSPIIARVPTRPLSKPDYSLSLRC